MNNYDYHIKVEHPWQSGPTELIAHAIEHLHKDTDFDQRIAFLLLDVGVETLFKTVLLLPEKVTAVKTSYGDRRKAVEGSFHTLVQGVELARPDIAKKYNLAHIQFYHEKRNQLYHEGNGITVDVHKTENYARVAIDLLREFLDVDLSHLLKIPELEIQKAQEKREHLQERKSEISRLVMQLGELSKAYVEILAPQITKATFFRKLKKLFEESQEKANIFLRKELVNAFPDWEIDEESLSSIPNILSDTNILYMDILNQFESLADIRSTYYESTLVEYDEEVVEKLGPLTGNGNRAIYYRSSDDDYEKDLLEFLDRCKESLAENIAILEELLGYYDD
jgi:hypothetical protein